MAARELRACQRRGIAATSAVSTATTAAAAPETADVVAALVFLCTDCDYIRIEGNHGTNGLLTLDGEAPTRYGCDGQALEGYHVRGI